MTAAQITTRHYARTGNIDQLDSLRRSGNLDLRVLALVAQKTHCIDLCNWMLDRNVVDTVTLSRVAAEEGDRIILRWMIDNDLDLDIHIIRICMAKYHIWILDWLYRQGYLDLETIYIHGVLLIKTPPHTSAMKWVRDNNMEQVCSDAIANGCDHNNVKVNKRTCVKRGVFPGHGCLIANCLDTEKVEGLCTIHKLRSTVY